ncbi:deoxynucleotidyltransferase terminal-interacting protein 2 [Xylocopa sonorina]|uniref:deoxynucleotidyltransferase terminal-interacting protein 2 n=1 Tax=Xylocopa sonorina TaxID=1818115 RepID=UPI00403AA0FA
MDIIIDTKGEADLLTRDRLVESDDDDLNFDENADAPPSKFFDVEEDLIERETSTKKVSHNPTKDFDLEDFEQSMGWTSRKKKKKKVPLPDVSTLKQEMTAVDKILEKSVIKPGFEQLQVVPPYKLSEKRLQEIKRKERSKTRGSDWFNMRAPEMTPEVRHDLEVLQMRSVLDPKRFYKKNDLKTVPKYFQIGKVVDSPLDYYSGRLVKKERKKTIVDELMADAQFSKYNKRKYKEIINEKNKLRYKAHKHAKKLKGKKK